MTRDLDSEINVGHLKPIKRRERSFEYALRDELKRRHIMFVKLKPTITGFPDRLALTIWNRMRLVELKRDENEALSEVQTLVHKDLRKMGINVLVVYGPDTIAAADIIERKLIGKP